MDKIKSTSQFEAQVILKLTETEARALEVFTSYGPESFIEFFYRHLGKTALQPHEDGVRSLFRTIKEELPKHLKKIDDVRDVWRGDKQAVNKQIADK